MPKSKNDSVISVVYLYQPKNNKYPGQQKGAVHLCDSYGKRKGKPLPFSTIGGMISNIMKAYIDRCAKEERNK